MLAPLFLAALAACGGPGLPARSQSLAQALQNAPEAMELEPLAVRQELLRELYRTATAQAGQPLEGAFLFPVAQSGAIQGAPAMDPRADLFLTADAGEPWQLVFEGRGERFGEERRESFQGLSEREAAELVARSLMHLWHLAPSAPVRVERVTGAPYAAAWVDGVLRINPVLLPLAASSAL